MRGCGRAYASDGLCTHGKAMTAPARKDLRTYPAQRGGGKVFVNLPEQVEIPVEDETNQPV